MKAKLEPNLWSGIVDPAIGECWEGASVYIVYGCVGGGGYGASFPCVHLWKSMASLIVGALEISSQLVIIAYQVGEMCT